MYVYDDEDNESMNDRVMKYTTYSSRAEMEYYESGQADQDAFVRKWEEEKEKERRAVEGLADMLELTGDCRKCPDFVELAEGFFSYNGLISSEQVDFLKHQCSACGGKGTGKPKDEKHEKWRDGLWSDIVEWVHNNEMRCRCCWCQNTFRIYGNYKDPDDEWKAIEEACGNCKYFGEGEA